MNKADRQEVDRRVAQVSEWLLDGESTYKIVLYCEQNWGIKRTQTQKYIKLAKQKWDEIYQSEFENNLKWHLIARRKLYNKCIADGDKSNARQVLNDIADIQGLKEIRIKSEHIEKHEYHLIIERPETDSDNGNGRITKTKIEQMAR